MKNINDFLKAEYKQIRELQKESIHDLYFRGCIDEITTIYAYINNLSQVQARKQLNEQ